MDIIKENKKVFIIIIIISAILSVIPVLGSMFYSYNPFSKVIDNGSVNFIEKSIE